MLVNIKSHYILQMIFLNIQEKIQLELVKYNKNLQSKLNKGLYHLKTFSGKYIIFESESKGKIYDAYNNCLIFEGEYLNGKRNGKVKEYNSNQKLKNESEYLNDKRNGLTKTYYEDGKIRTEEEYINDKLWNLKEYNRYSNLINEIKEGKGIIKEYNSNGNIICQYEFKNGKLNGKKYSYYDNNNIKSEDNYVKDEKNGPSKTYYNDGKIKSEKE